MSDATTRSLRRGVALTLASALLAGGTYVAVATPAQAAAETDSSITVEWGTGDVSVGPDATATEAEVKAANLDHADLTADDEGNDAGSGHWTDLKDIKVTVSKTTSLSDETVTVTVSGFTGPTVNHEVGMQALGNYVQAMQCWGPDPTADDFYETCQYGAQQGFNSIESFIGGPSTARGHANVRDLVSEASTTPYPFRAVTGQKTATIANVRPGGAQNKVYSNGLEQFFTASTSNEVTYQPVRNEGTARFPFQTQSGATQPYLGCGDRAGTRCWLVVVPRGTHAGIRAGAVSGAETCDSDALTYGQTVRSQAQHGSPVAPDCSYFDDRVVIPLDFDDIDGGCTAGSVERRTVGTEFLVEAYSSWQQRLCAEAGTALAYNTNSGDLSRAQLLTAQNDFAVTARRLDAGSIGSTDAALLESADLAYAPLANTGLVLAINSSTPADIKLTPRMIAKFLTQSYEFDIPYVDGSSTAYPSESRDSLRNPSVFLIDPEWAALGNPEVGQFKGADFVVVGPQGDDAIVLLWQYILSDADARAFLEGEPDPWGMTVNPYYLPADDPRALGGGVDLLGGKMETFPKADGTVVPDAEGAKRIPGGYQIDSTSFSPYATSFEANAARIGRGDNQRTNAANPDRKTYWEAAPPPSANQQYFVTGPTTAAAAAAYSLATASVSVPLSTMTTEETVATSRNFVAPNDATMGAAVDSSSFDGIGGAAPNFSTWPADAYPLTFTLSGVADLNSRALDDRAREDYAKLVEYAAGEGQVRGEDPGQLPEGFVPLASSQRDAAVNAAAQLRASIGRFADRPAEQTPDAPEAASRATTSGAAAAGGPADTAPPASTTTTTTATAELSSTNSSIGSVAIGGGLIAGLVGLAVSPFLLRRNHSSS